MCATPSTPPQRSPVTNPFRGLIPYEDNDRLFARDADVQLVQGRFWASSVTVLFAGSGVGKSSFLNAKLLPVLRSRLGTDYVFVPKEWTRSGDPTGVVLQQLEAIAKNRPTRKGNVLVLDQFEEVFQYLTDSERLKSFGQTLASIVSENSEYQTRLLIAIREEFLADLTLFDTFVAGILTNYYRLERVTADQAKMIIERTADQYGAECNKGNLELLISDLSDVWYQTDIEADTEPQAQKGPLSDSTIELGIESTGQAETRNNSSSILRRVHIDLPYLQIVCRKIWDREVSQGGEAPFLSTYQKGDAPLELKDYCRTHLSSFSWNERYLLARAIAHLTGPHEAKKAVKVSDLAFEMKERDPAPLANILRQLSDKHVRILRESDRTEEKGGRVQEFKIYELYHDMYSQMLWKWREDQLAWRQRYTIAKAILAASLLWFLILSPLWNMTFAWRALKTSEGTKTDVSDLLAARNAFARTMLLRFLGDHLWREYTAKFSSKSAFREDTDGALLYQLADPAIANDSIDSEAANRLIAPVSVLDGTYRIAPGEGSAVDATLLAPKSNNRALILTATDGGHLIQWDHAGRIVSDSAMVAKADVSQSLGQHTLCLSPDGAFAVVISGFSSESRSSVAQVLLSLVPTSGAPILGKTIEVNLSYVLSASTLPDAGRVSGNRNVDPILVAIAGARGSFNSNSTKFAVSIADKLHVFDTTLDETVATVGFGPQHYVDAVMFMDDPSSTPSYKDLLLVSERSYSGDSNIHLFSVKRDMHELNDKNVRAFSLPQGARCISGNLGLLLKANDAWEWVLPDKTRPEKVKVTATDLSNVYLPQVFDEGRKLLLSQDIGGTLVISRWKNDHFELGEPLSISESARHQLKLLSVASTSHFGASKFLTLEGSAVRLWDLGKLEASTEGEPFPNRPISLCSVDQAVCVAVTATTGGGAIWKVDKVAQNEKNAPDFPWEISAPRSEPPQRLIFDKNRSHLLAWFSDGVFYAEKGDQIAKPFPPLSQDEDAEFGPGPDLVTVVASNKVELRDLHSPEAVVWSADCNQCRLLHTSDDRGIVLYTNAWIHRITPDPRNAIHRWLESDGMWPHIVSVAQATQIKQVRAADNSDNSKVLVEGSATPVDFTAIDEADNKSRPIGFAPWSFAPCPPLGGTSQQSSAPSEPNRAMCEWERRTGRHIGSPPEP